MAYTVSECSLQHLQQLPQSFSCYAEDKLLQATSAVIALANNNGRMLRINLEEATLLMDSNAHAQGS